MQITKLLHRMNTGERGALRRDPAGYDELKKPARSHLRREAGAVPLQTTALVHEVFLRLAEGRHPIYENRSHFYGIASRLMRQVLVDTARARAAEKRGPGQEIALADLPDRVPQPNRTLLAMDDALQRLEQTEPIKAHYFGGMTAEESAIALSIPVHVVRRELRLPGHGCAWNWPERIQVRKYRCTPTSATEVPQASREKPPIIRVFCGY